MVSQMVSQKEFDIEVSSKDLSSALSVVTSVIEKRNVEHILFCIKLSVLNNKLCIEGTDGSIFIRQFLSAKIHDDSLNLIVEGRILERMIRGLSDEFIKILYISQSNELLVSSLSFELKLIALSSSTFPIFPLIESPPSFEILSSSLFELINCTEFSLSKDEIRYNLNGIYICGSEQKIQAASTDNFRLSTFNRSDQKIYREFSIILPTKTISFIKNLNTPMLTKEVFEVTLHNNLVQFRSDKICIVSKLVDGVFPQYTALIPQDNDNKLIIQKSHLASAIERIAFITDENSKAIKMSIASDKVEISAYTHSKGTARQVIEKNVFDYKGQDMVIAFQPKYILDILSLIKVQSEAAVQIAIKSAAMPILITSEQLPHCLFVIMPIKIS